MLIDISGQSAPGEKAGAQVTTGYTEFPSGTRGNNGAALPAPIWRGLSWQRR
jgi:hypothetical protein